ncbi:MAG: hypothetical protein ACI81R_000477 [Bradymonadia bacterium]|jgi:hypothetical protein
MNARGMTRRDILTIAASTVVIVVDSATANATAHNCPPVDSFEGSRNGAEQSVAPAIRSGVNHSPQSPAGLTMYPPLVP